MSQIKNSFFGEFVKMEKIYKRYMAEAVAEYHFTPNEITVLLFLYNNAPELDTATQIARYKGISKGLVAKSVESLCRRGLLEARRDPADRRVVHLTLSAASSPVATRLRQGETAFLTRLQAGIEPTAVETLNRTLAQMLKNLNGIFEGKGEDE